MVIIDKPKPTQFFLVSFSLKKVIPVKDDNTITEMLLIPNISELSIKLLSSECIKKYNDP